MQKTFKAQHCLYKNNTKNNEDNNLQLPWQVVWHSSKFLKLFWFPRHPPYLNTSHIFVSLL